MNAPQELNLDEMETVGGGFWPIGLSIAIIKMATMNYEDIENGTSDTGDQDADWGEWDFSF